jgi:hypothetical protein
MWLFSTGRNNVAITTNSSAPGGHHDMHMCGSNTATRRSEQWDWQRNSSGGRQVSSQALRGAGRERRRGFLPWQPLMLMLCIVSCGVCTVTYPPWVTSAYTKTTGSNTGCPRSSTKLSLCLIKHYTMKPYGVVDPDPRFLDLDTSRRWVVRFMRRPLYPRGRAPDTHWIRGWVDHSVGLNTVEVKILDPTGARTPTPLSSSQ